MVENSNITHKAPSPEAPLLAKPQAPLSPPLEIKALAPQKTDIFATQKATEQTKDKTETASTVDYSTGFQVDSLDPKLNKQASTLGKLNLIQDIGLESITDLRELLKQLNVLNINLFEDLGDNPQSKKALAQFNDFLMLVLQQGDRLTKSIDPEDTDKLEIIQQLNRAIPDLQQDIQQHLAGKPFIKLRFDQNREDFTDKDNIRNAILSWGVPPEYVTLTVLAEITKEEALEYKNLGLLKKEFMPFLIKKLKPDQLKALLQNFSPSELRTHLSKLTEFHSLLQIKDGMNPRFIAEIAKKGPDSLFNFMDFQKWISDSSIKTKLRKLNKNSSPLDVFELVKSTFSEFCNEEEILQHLERLEQQGFSLEQSIVSELDKQLSQTSSTPEVNPENQRIQELLNTAHELLETGEEEKARGEPSLATGVEMARELPLQPTQKEITYKKYPEFQEYITEHQRDHPNEAIDSERLDMLRTYGVDPQRILHYRKNTNLNQLDINNLVLGEYQKKKLPTDVEKFILKNNISFPARYHKELARVLIQPLHFDHKPTAVIFMAQNDYNTALDDTQLSKEFTKLSVNYNVKLIEIDQDHDIEEALGAYEDQSIDLVIIAGHGSPNDIDLAHGREQDEAFLDSDDYEIFHKLKNKLNKDEGKIILCSCETGNSLEGTTIKEVMQAETGLTIYAPACSFSDLVLNYDEDGKVIEPHFIRDSSKEW